jgi:NAD(P)-dependent dehydrogenase (short-subunit alcohol dehydrogenase family)
MIINYLSKFKLDKKVSLVMGGTGLLGKEIVKAFCEAGAITIIIDLDDLNGLKLKYELSKKGYFCDFYKCDLTNYSDVKTIIEEINKKFHKIDILVNTFYPRTNDWKLGIEDINYDSWAKNIDMHLNSYCMITKYICDIMKLNNLQGSIINMSSIYGVLGPDFTIYEGTNITNPPAYSAIKGGIINFTKYVASYYGKYNIRVNTICPGGVFDNQDKKFVKNYNNKTPMKRMAKPEEIASVCLFLASDASSYITGQAIMVDGGWSII